METVTDSLFMGSKITADGDCSHEIKRCLLLGRKDMYDQPRQHIKKQRHYFANKSPSTPSYGFSSSHVWMWELDYKESWALKNWCFWTVVVEKTLENPLDYKQIKPFNPKGVCREPAWESGHVGEFWCKASQNSRGAPLGLPERLPQNQNLSVLPFYDFHQLLCH